MTMKKCFRSLLRLYKHYLVVWWKLRMWKQGVSQSGLNTEASPPSSVCQYGWNFVPWFYVPQYLTLFTPPPNLCLEQTAVCSNAWFPDMDIYWYLLGFVLQFYIGKKNLLKMRLYKGVNAKRGMLKETLWGVRSEWALSPGVLIPSDDYSVGHWRIEFLEEVTPRASTSSLWPQGGGTELNSSPPSPDTHSPFCSLLSQLHPLRTSIPWPLFATRKISGGRKRSL